MSFSWPRIGLLFLLALLMQSPAYGAKQRRAVSAKLDCESRLTPTYLTEPYIMESDMRAFSELADEQNLLINLIVPNPASRPFSQQHGYVAKTGILKLCRSAKEGAALGLVHCRPEMFRNEKEWLENKKFLASKGYFVLDKDQDYLVEDKYGNRYYSDYDLLGFYDVTTGTTAYSEEFRREMNRRLGRELVQHGPLEEYIHYKKVGLKFPILSFTPDGNYVISNNAKELKAVYGKYRIPWLW